jgi:hypothetical protein
MTKKFLIHSCPGAGTMFVTSLFAKMMNITINTKISPVGDCHDMGNGIWQVPNGGNIDFAHKFDTVTNTMQLRYQAGATVYCTHAITPEFIDQNTDLITIQIGADVSDFYNITKLAVKKAWPTLWTETEYNKWKSPYYPPYSRDNIANSELICNDLITDLKTTQTAHWYQQYASIKYSHVIDFRTVMGINDKDLVQEVANITGGQITDDIRKFVNEYQQLNKKLSFN